MHPRLLLARLLLVRKCPRLLRLRVPFARHLLVLVLLVLPLLVLPSRLQLTVRSVASSVRADSSRFAAVACFSIRRAVPLLVLPPLLRLALQGSPGWHRRRLHSLSLFRRHRHLLPSR